MTIEERISLLDRAFKKTKMGNYSEALEDFEYLETESTNPQDLAQLHLFQASCLTDMRRPTEALKRIKSVDQSRLGFANLVVFEFEYARILRGQGELAEALKRTKAGLTLIDSIDDKSSTLIVARNLHTMLGILLAELGRCAEAKPLLEQVPADDEGWAEAKLHLGDCIYGCSHYREAIDVYRSIVSRGKSIHPIFVSAALRNIGCAFYFLGDFAMAVENLTPIVDEYHDYPDIEKELFDILASAYSRLGKQDEAQKYRRLSSGSQSVQ